MNKQHQDSFFTQKNQIDGQLDRLNLEGCEKIIDATVRRMTRIHGSFHTAVFLQRLADICAGFHVYPIEHWKEKPTPANDRSNKRDAFWRGVGWGALGCTAFNVVLGWLL